MIFKYWNTETKATLVTLLQEYCLHYNSPPTHSLSPGSLGFYIVVILGYIQFCILILFSFSFAFKKLSFIEIIYVQ